MSFEQPFRSDVEYYEGRADGIATTSGVSVDEARRERTSLHRQGGHPELAERLRER